MTTKTLFLEKNHIDGKFKVLNQKGHCIGDGEMPEDAIHSARLVSDKPIYFGSGVSVHNQDDVFTSDEIINELASLAGMKVYCAYDDDMRIIGYTMEVRE